MKKCLFILCVVAAALLSACNPDNYQHPDVLIGKWASVANAKDGALILYINKDYIEVQNGSWDYRPFSNDYEWEYYMSKDSVLHIYRTEYDGDEYETSSYELDLSFSDSYNTLTLWYDPPFSSVRKYTFMRR